MKFEKSFSDPDPIPEAGINRAVAHMKTGHLFRYNPLNINDNVFADYRDSPVSEVSLLEKEFCNYTGHNYCVAVNSCSSALFLSLKALGLPMGAGVFCNAFTFTAVPSSIVHAGGVPVYIESTNNYVLDVEDLKQKISNNPAVKFLMLSYMRGHIADIEEIKRICDKNEVTIIEDCAHALGTKLFVGENSFHIGKHGAIACFSSQSNKLLNSGEGGFLVTNDKTLAALSILAAGSYETLYLDHLAAPEPEVFESIKIDVPNYSVRMSNLTAAVLRPQLPILDEKIEKFEHLYENLALQLSNIPKVRIPSLCPYAKRVGDSCQFNIEHLTGGELVNLKNEANEMGIKIQLFGYKDNSRYFKNWAYSFKTSPKLQKTEAIISAAFDMRIPIYFNTEDIHLIAKIISELLQKYR